jgi:hypothetical protein
MAKLGKGIYKRGDVFWYAPPMVNGQRAKMISLGRVFKFNWPSYRC